MMALEIDAVRRDAAAMLARTDDELYAELVPRAEVESIAFSFDGRVARGRELFRSIWQDVRGGVCGYYHRHEKTVGNKVDVVALIATPLLGNPAVSGISVVAFAALIVKIGVAELCAEPRKHA
jgi:hypothetical protein